MASDDGSGEFGHGEWKRPGLTQSLEDGGRKVRFGVSVERDVVAGMTAELAERGNVRTNDATAGHQRFDDREAEAFDDGRRDDGFAVAIAPLKLGFGETLPEKNGIFETAAANRVEDAPGFRAGNTDDDQSRGWVKVFGAKKSLEDPDEKHDVFVEAMLCDTEKERFSAPAGKRGLRRANRAGRDAVVDTAHYPPHVDWKVVIETQ